MNLKALFVAPDGRPSRARVLATMTISVMAFGGMLALDHARARPTSHGAKWFFTEVCPETFSKWQSTGTARQHFFESCVDETHARRQ
jgi:hypothetical protein